MAGVIAAATLRQSRETARRALLRSPTHTGRANNSTPSMTTRFRAGDRAGTDESARGLFFYDLPEAPLSVDLRDEPSGARAGL